MSIDLRSDTVTKPTDELRLAIARAPVGDDTFGEDASVNALESHCAAMFGKEAAVFTATGTMSNQLAVRALTSPGDEVILDTQHHINYFESAQAASMGGVALNPIDCESGIVTPELLEAAIARKPRTGYYGRSKLVCIENTIACHGGRVFPLRDMRALFEAAMKREIAVYVDGARILNACVASGASPADYARFATLLSLDFAKGLGAPFGSILVGPRAVVERARKFRKWYGGGFHQIGMMAAGAHYAVEHHVERLADDHKNARAFAASIAGVPGLEMIPVQPETNIVMFDVARLRTTAASVVDEAKKRGVLLVAWTATLVRAVTHIGVSASECRAAADIVCGVLQGASERAFGSGAHRTAAVAARRSA